MNPKEDGGFSPELPRASARGHDIRNMLSEAEASLSAHGVDDARLNAELLLAHVTGLDRMAFRRPADHAITEEQAGKFFSALRRREAREPLQYIVGETEFMGHSFVVDRRVLIPRPETEILVEEVIGRCKDLGSVRILDIGTGSGNIAVSLAKALPGADIVAIDKSPGALEVARLNAERNGVSGRIRVLCADILESLPDTGLFQAIVSNPPYLSTRELAAAASEVREYEPPEATTDGGDGLEMFRVIAGAGMSLLAPAGLVFVETGYDQAKPVGKIFAATGFTGIRFVSDYLGFERVVAGVRP